MKVLVACEESQTVTKAFRERGHEAFSCDLQPCSGGCPQWHIQGNALDHLNDGWDLLIAHPPCTYMSNAGACRMYDRPGKVFRVRDCHGLQIHVVACIGRMERRGVCGRADKTFLTGSTCGKIPETEFDLSLTKR